MSLALKAIYFIVLFCFAYTSALQRRSIDLIQAHSLISDSRIPLDITPNSYDLELHPFPEQGNFNGNVKITATWIEKTDEITLHADQCVEIIAARVTKISSDDNERNASTAPTPISLKVEKTVKKPKSQLFIIHLEEPVDVGSQCEIEIKFAGTLSNDTSEALFRSSYVDPKTKSTKWFVSSYLRPNLARRIFPCFDEPAYKATFTLHLARKKEMVAISNMPLESSQDIKDNPGWVWDHFQRTPPMSTFALGIVISDLSSVLIKDSNTSKNKVGEIRVWARPDFIDSLRNVTEKVNSVIDILEEFWSVEYPLPKLDIVALPNFQATRPADSWGILLFKESELTGKGSWNLAHELAYQWLGDLATPYWWSDAHINTALVRFVTAYTILKIGDANSINNWPMTMLYSIYYEFSKRYPHGKSTVIKQDSISAKTELVFRMLNYTLGESTLKNGLQKFMKDRQYKTFFGDDIWNSITEQAKKDKTLEDNISVNEIAASWITKDRLPVVNVTRNYKEKSAVITQRVYLRERPHDVPDQDKFIWWLPIILITQDKLNFENSKPKVWMKLEKEIKLENVASANDFIIINPEEIAPFPVNYDETNWNMLAKFLCTEGRTKIPVTTRAKLLHDAWNLAYAGDLSFATALNMTLFLKNERENLAWYPVFTFIDHIGRHIESPDISEKFQAYVRLLLEPLYKELGSEPVDDENDMRAHLRSSCKTFLCQAGYKPCIEEAQAAYRKWMEMENPNEGNPLANQYLCPVFKWGTWEEWYFGFQRVLQFPADRKQSERTYLLKTLAGCPNNPATIDKFLNFTILSQDEQFKDNDIYLIYNMLTGNPKGYMALFNFLKENWDKLKIRFEAKPHLWNSLVTSATTVFKTQVGLDMVSELYVQRQGEFGTADFVIERALKNIKEEVKWSNENLPVIEKWLENYLNENTFPTA